jgi:transposase
MKRKVYPSDVHDDEWAFTAPYFSVMTEAAPQRDYLLRDVFNGLRWIIRAGAPWRMMAHDLPPWWVVYQQSQRWIKAGVFEAMVHDLCTVLRLAKGRQEQPTEVIFDSRTLQSSLESGGRAGDPRALERTPVLCSRDGALSDFCAALVCPCLPWGASTTCQATRGRYKRRWARMSH